MKIKVAGDYTHNGDIIENGGTKNVYQGIMPVKPLDKKELKRKVDMIRGKIESFRMWFSVCKYMMWNHMVAEMDFKGACEILKELYPDLKLNYSKFNDLNMGTLKGPVEKWKYVRGEPFEEEDTFEKYKFIAVKLYEV